MQQILILFHVLVCIVLIGLVLIQHGKGADMGAGFGSGSSQTMFGSAGATPFLVKITGLLAAIFFVSCLGLTYFITEHVKSSPAIDLTRPAMSIHSPVPLTKVQQTHKKNGRSTNTQKK